MMTNIDITIILAYVIGLFAFAIYMGLRETAEDFLILSRRAPFWLVLFSVVSTWVGIGTTVATAASGYDKGLSLGLTAGAGGLVGITVASVIAPRLKRFGDEFRAHTLGDFFAIRYSVANRFLVGGLILMVYSLLGAGQFVGLASILTVWSGLSLKVAILFAALSTVIYTAFAGIKSDFYTDAVHFCIMVIVFMGVMFPLALRETDGGGALRALPSSFFDPFAYGGVSFFVAGLIFGAGGVFVTMEIWQRIYASASGRVARWALLASGLIIVAFYLLSAFFGMVTRVVEPGLQDRNQALFILIKRLLPTGLLGLGIAAFVAVFISTVNTMIMVASATLTKDFYRGWLRPGATESQTLTAGRVSTFVAGVLALGIAMALPDIVTLSVNALFLLLVLLPAVLGGFFWRRSTAIASFASIFSGFAVTTGALFFSPDTAFVPGFLVSVVVFVVVSFASRHSAQEKVHIRL